MIDYEELAGGEDALEWPDPDERRAAAMCYTSGTTGRPKGVVYSHRSLVLPGPKLDPVNVLDLLAGEKVTITPVSRRCGWRFSRRSTLSPSAGT